MSSEKRKIGICQSRGLGDLVIALPIAKYYADQGHEIYWPICEPFWSSVKDVAPWVKWIPIPVDSNGDFFYTEPMKRLKAFGVTESPSPLMSILELTSSN